MNHFKRSAYLDMMGVKHWFARKALSGAKKNHIIFSTKPSSELDLEKGRAANGATAQAAEYQPAKKVLVQRGLAVAEMLDLDAQPSLAKSSTPTEPVTVEAKEEKNTQSDVLLNFKLQAILLDDILIIDDVSDVNLVSSAYLNWFEAIAYSLNMNTSKEAIKMQDCFAWPLENSMLFDNTKAAAKEVLQAWLLRKLQESSVKHILLMGKAAAEYLCNAEDSDEIYGAEAKLPFASFVNVRLSYGTSQIWHEPLLKRKFWQHLQALGS